MSAQSVLSLTGRPRPSETPERPAAAAPAAPSASERRLKLVIESAPVSLLITDPENKVLAANRTALTLLGVERLDDVIGKTLDRLVAPSDRERFVEFVASVCRGEAGSLQYELATADGTQRTMETHAVPLRREASAPAAFLGATWDVSDRKQAATAHQQLLQKVELLEAQRSAERETFEEALRQARHANDELSNGQSHEAEERHRQAVAEWAAERNNLLEQLKGAEGRHTHLAEQWMTERNGLVEQLRGVEGRFGSEADKWRTERASLLEQLKAVEERQHGLTGEWDTERMRLLEQLQAAEGRHGSIADQWNAERADLIEQLKSAEHRHGSVTDQWNAERAGLLEQLKTLEGQHGAAAEHWNTERAGLFEQLKGAEQRLGQATVDWTAQRDALASRLQAVDQQHSHAVQQWGSEREALLTKMRELEERHETLAAQLLIEQNTQRMALEDATRQHEAALASKDAERQQLERTLAERAGERDRLNEALQQTRAAHDAIAQEQSRTQQALRDAEEQRERQAAQWTSEREGMLGRLIALEHAQREYQASLNARTAENHQLQNALKDAGGRYEKLLAESQTERKELSGRLDNLERQSKAMAEHWREGLAGVLSPLKESNARIERLLGTFDATPAAAAQMPAAQDPHAAQAETPEAEQGEEGAWRF
jgi:PAS domain S-box-containing protein